METVVLLLSLSKLALVVCVVLLQVDEHKRYVVFAEVVCVALVRDLLRNLL